ncbi:hypothetical protein [Oceanibium sediminis]|uniref:hypothetical protein n=1 Tax=Oceanibium sediminis TaxID=2026339 RepID=UPI000DD4930B|nr:hypothetical protein [Oceanibium sediminis]
MSLRVIACGLVLALGACSGGSGSNPLGSFPSLGSLNPFGGNDDGSDATVAGVVADDTVLVAQLESVTPESALRGVILKATGIAPSVGYYNAQLVPVNGGLPDERGIATYDFRVTPPEVSSGGPVQARRLIAATFIHDDDLAGIRGFRVRSAGNTVDLRR